MQVNGPCSVPTYPVIAAPEAESPAQQRGLDTMFPQDEVVDRGKRGRMAALGCGGATVSAVFSTTVSIFAPEALVTTTGGAILSAPISSTVDCARGERVNTTFGQCMGAVKSGYQQVWEKI